MLCGSTICGCSFQSSSLVLSGSGQPGDPLTLETAGPAIVETSADVSSPFIGQTIFETATGLLKVYNGSEWVTYAGETWPPSCQVHDAAQSLTSGTPATVVFDLDEQLDPWGFHSNSVLNTRITPNIAAWYQFFGRIQLVSAASTITRIRARVLLNGTTAVGEGSVWPGATSFQHGASAVSYWVLMNGTTDYVELEGLQTDSGGTTRAVESWLNATWRAAA